MEKGEIYWVDFGVGEENEPAYRRPALVIQSDQFNRSAIASVIVAPISSNLKLARAPGNVPLSSSESGLPKDSVVVVSQIVAVSKQRLEERVSVIDANALFLVDNGLRLVLDL